MNIGIHMQLATLTRWRNMPKKLLLLSLCFAVFITALSVRTAPASQAPRRIEITAKRFQFDPEFVTLKKSEPVVIVLSSLDVSHSIRFRDLGIEVKASKGKPGIVSFTPEKTGDFVGHCAVFCGARHSSMTITLHVVD
jgi:cytochrome c oxidase subunit 2